MLNHWYHSRSLRRASRLSRCYLGPHRVLQYLIFGCYAPGLSCIPTPLYRHLNLLLHTEWDTRTWAPTLELCPERGKSCTCLNWSNDASYRFVDVFILRSITNQPWHISFRAHVEQHMSITNIKCSHRWCLTKHLATQISAVNESTHCTTSKAPDVLIGTTSALT